MDINRLRREADNYYNGSPREVKNLVSQFFMSMDSNCDGGVDFQEIQDFLIGRAFLARYVNGDVFRQLDTDKNGTLDFSEFITLFYIMFMCYSCDICRVPLRGQKHLTCGTCFTSRTHSGNTYDLCGSCFSRGCFRHEHEHGNLLDYYTLVMNEGSSHGGSFNIRQPQREPPPLRRSETDSQLTTKPQNSRQIFEQIASVLQAAAAVSTIATAASCSIM